MITPRLVAAAAGLDSMLTQLLERVLNKTMPATHPIEGSLHDLIFALYRHIGNLRGVRTHSIILHGSTSASKAALHLVNRSTWFQIEPLPDDQWELTVKEEVPLPLQFTAGDRLHCIRMRPMQQHQQQ